MNLYEMISEHLPKQKESSMLCAFDRAVQIGHQEIIEVLKRCELDEKKLILFLKDFFTNNLNGSYGPVTGLAKALISINLIKVKENNNDNKDSNSLGSI